MTGWPSVSPMRRVSWYLVQLLHGMLHCIQLRSLAFLTPSAAKACLLTLLLLLLLLQCASVPALSVAA